MEPGDVIERYTVQALLGRGAVATVYRVRHNELGTLHALKVLQTAGREHVERLMTEGRVQALLAHPHVVPVTDVVDVGGVPALLMTYVDGPTLAAFLTDVKADVSELERLFRGVVSGVAHAHSIDVVHRDLKPANVLLAAVDGQRQAQITDFGLAKVLADRADPRWSSAGQLLGTPAYMAPEQLRGAAADKRTDVWALGVVLYEMVCGQRPFVGVEPADVLAAISRGPAPVGALAPDLSAHLARVVAACLSPDPAARPADAGAVEAMLDAGPQEEGQGRIVGDFELLEVIGSGAVGTVYRARQVGLGRDVAVKVIARPQPRDDVAEGRFLREVQALARVDHANVPSILAHGTTDTELYYAMALVHGVDLSRVDPVEVPAVSALAGLFADTADGLHALHEAGVVHRDIKPSNLMLTRDEARVMVMDLGLAQLSEGGPALTRGDGHILGTLRYMPPEQLQRNLLEVDRRADVYALGASLTELCTGAPFFDGDSEQRLIQQVLHEEPPPAHERAPHVPVPLSLVLRKATRKRAHDRYATAAAFADDLRAVAAGRPPSVRPPGVWGRARRWVRRNALAATVMFTALAFLWLSGLGLGGMVSAAGYRNRTVDRTYAALVPRHGGYAGLGWMHTWLPTAEADHVRVTWEEGLPVRLELRQGNGAFQPFVPPVLDQVFDRDGRVLRVVYRDQDDVEQYAESVSWDVDDDGRDRATRRWVTPDGRAMANPDGGAEVIEEAVDERGFPVHRRMLAADGHTPRPDADGVFGLRDARDEWGRLVERTWLDAEGRPTPNRHGIAIRRWSWGEGVPVPSMDPLESAVFDADGSPTHDANGVHRVRIESPPQGFSLLWSEASSTETRFDEEGRPVTGADGFARTTLLTEEGTRTRRWFGPAGQPVPGPGGAPVRVAQTSPYPLPMVLVEAGHALQGPHGEPWVGAEGYAQKRQTPVAEGTQVVWLGPDGAPVLRPVDLAAGHLEGTGSFVCLGLDLAPAPCRWGWTERRRTPHPAGGTAEERYVDASGALVFSFREHAAKVETARDRRGRAIEHRRTGPDGALAGGPGRPGRDVHTYDVAGREGSRAHLDASGAPALSFDGFHRIETTHDGAGRPLTERTFDLEGRPVMHAGHGYAAKEWTRDPWGRPVAAHTADAAGRPVAVDGCVRRTWRYDRWGRVVERGCHGPAGEVSHARLTLDRAGRLLVEATGGTTTRHERDALGRIVHTTTTTPRGTTAWAITYDAQGRVAERRGDHTTVSFEYDAFHRVVGEVHTPGPRIARTVDDRGLVVAETMEPAGSFARHEWDYDAFGRPVSERWVGPDGALLDQADGVARRQWTYTESGVEGPVQRFSADGTEVP